MLIDGKKIAESVLARIVEGVGSFRLAQGRAPRLAAVLVGESASSRKFLELKKTAAEKMGIECRIYEFPEGITTQKLRKEIVGIAKASVNDGVIVELPLPAHINTQYILNAVPMNKDVDMLSEKSQGSFFAGRAVILPPAVEAVKIIFSAMGGPAFGGEDPLNFKGRLATVFGYGLLIGRPVSHWLAQGGATVSIINEFTVNSAELSLTAGIIISGVGKPGLIKADMIKEGAVVIDFGYENVDGRMAGDVDLAGVGKKDFLITPVPGGVGPVVIAAVFKNLLELLGTKKTNRK